MRPENLDNALDRFNYLKAALNNPSAESKYVIEAMSGQAKFAALSVPNKFSNIALNTLKEAADIVLSNHVEGDGGWKALDGLRRRLNSKGKSLTKKSISAKNNKAKLEKMYSKELINSLEYSNIIMTKAYYDLYGRIAGLVKSGEIDDRTRLSLGNLLEDQNKMFSYIFEPKMSKQSAGSALSIVKGGKP